MLVHEVRRYPVKAMAGESLDAVELDPRGLAGDRWWAVVDDDGRLATGKDSRRFRRRDGVFDLAASTVAGGVRVAGAGLEGLAGDPDLDAALSAHLGASVRLREEGEVSHQDGSPVSLVGTASLAWCVQHLGVDGEVARLRTNLVVETDEPFVEERWVGQRLRVGGAEVDVLERTERCRMVDVAQDGLPEQPGWLRGLGRERDVCLGVYAAVRVPGPVRVGDPVRLAW